MTQVARYRIGWVLALVCLSAGAFAVLRAFDFRAGPALLLAALLVVPGRIQGHFWRSCFRGRRALDANDPDAAVTHFETFLNELRRRPWLRRLVWLSWPGYTADAAAMAWTNLGAAHLDAGRLDLARQACERAATLDSATPLPWFNLGLVHARRGEPEAAARAFAEARRLGYRGDLLDRVQRELAGALARVEGTGLGAGADA